ncbi:signal transduction histidine kinase [Bacillus sp. SLBN-46]|uniref:sensor histidine kinase n=1 Tax=Bacillus sp. SLBN-46 TaxID=3042283 RepID=UPI00285DF2AA|nr:HAMP domain-containing sensor histidine kinase [Bacillus sp. SLBN-46]MDR6121650.1 signal transduction histidine kinase [Bacillus sp. SLBN-46]
MRKKIKFNSISFKLGLLFSGVFIILLLILGTILYGVFTNLFVDYIKQDLLARGNNHAEILEDRLDETTISHVVAMENSVVTNVVIVDSNGKVIGSSVTPDIDMKQHLLSERSNKPRYVEVDWKEHKYIITVSPVGNGRAFVYMYYPSYILRDIVYVMNMLIIVASLGMILLALGFIGLLSRRIVKPLLTMKEATNNMALGKYKQVIPVKGSDEISELGNSIQILGEQLQYYEESRNEFLAAVSHELRTPLTYIKGYSDILSKGIIKDRHEQAEYLKIINKETNRISFLVNDLLEMSKLQVGKFELEKECVYINPSIEKVISSLKPAASNKGLNLNKNLQIETDKVNIDIQRMEQVFYNLIENAIKYTLKGDVTVRSYSKKGFTIIEIEDTGIGIPEEDLPKIWDQFYRVDQSRTRKTGGTGLGLYVVKNIIESHDGQIRVNSKENEGSTFTIFLKHNKWEKEK